MSNPKIKDDIISPLTFMKKTPFKCQGYWDIKGGYQPIISKDIWIHKQKWLDRVYTIEQLIVDGKIGSMIQYRGFAFSRIESNAIVGSAEYCDHEYDMCWPEGYVSHYIEKHNVMPTKKFFKYVNKRYLSLFQQ